MPAPISVWNRWLSATTSPALVIPREGTTGVKPSLSRAARNAHSAPDTPAAPSRKPLSRSSIAPRTAAAGSGGPVPAPRSRSARWNVRWRSSSRRVVAR